MEFFDNNKGYLVLDKMVKAIQDNKAYLGDVDGLIGDGDHGMNMNKGFTMFSTRYSAEKLSLSESLDNLGMVLMNEIGGSMGPIYGTIFIALGDSLSGKDKINKDDLAQAFSSSIDELFDIIDARVGDKTLVDTLYPAVEALKNTDGFKEALKAMKVAAENGKESTKNLVAKFGRSSRLGERSRGVLDAGSVSCNIIIQAMADGILENIEEA